LDSIAFWLIIDREIRDNLLAYDDSYETSIILWASILSISCSIFYRYFTIYFSSILRSRPLASEKCLMAESKLSSSL
jgi:hypothetical protein